MDMCLFQLFGNLRDLHSFPTRRSSDLGDADQAVEELVHPLAAERDLAADLVALAEPEAGDRRSEEHTSELQSQFHLVCRLLLEKKNNVQLIFLLDNNYRLLQ